jgi:hypothetical protein
LAASWVSTSFGVRPSGPASTALQNSGNSHLDKFIEIAGRDRQKFEPLEKRIILVTSLFQHALVELQPGKMPIEKILWGSQLIVSHFCLEIYPVRVTAMLPELSQWNLLQRRK